MSTPVLVWNGKLVRHSEMDKNTLTGAALIVVGDEILAGQVQDSATHYLANWLVSRGHELRSVEILPDSAAELEAALERAIGKYDYVFTTGGMGITHDDITIECVARTLGRPVILHPEILALLEHHYGAELTESRRLMARAPEGSEIIHNEHSLVPGLNIGNRIFMLPGVPMLMRDILKGLDRRFPSCRPMVALHIGVWCEESVFSEPLGRVQSARPDVRIGSYPFWRQGEPGCNIVIKGGSQTGVDAAVREIETALQILGVKGIIGGIDVAHET